ncbi:conserved hypothetical protein [delta proteobacterium NaphS2]|nr:conserved hypothetical protein [delta proteobacterium NaphS2]
MNECGCDEQFFLKPVHSFLWYIAFIRLRIRIKTSKRKKYRVFKNCSSVTNGKFNEPSDCVLRKSEPHILFVTEKWCDSNPDLGLSNSFHNLFGSIRNAGIGTYDTFHFDEYAYENAKPGDDQLIDLCREKYPDLIILTFLVNGNFNPKLETLCTIRRQLGIPIVAVWFDSVKFDVIYWMEMLSPIVDLNVALDSRFTYPHIVLHDRKFMNLWTPQDPTVFLDPNLERDIDVSFVGSIRGRRDRIKGLKVLKREVNIYHVGGQREKPVSIDEYANILMRSKITLNFSGNKYFGHQMKGRVLEAMMCGAAVMESDNPETSEWFKPMKDYIPFRGTKDLVDKVRYYLENDKERQKIARNGYLAATQKYSCKRFWNVLLAEVEK